MHARELFQVATVAAANSEVILDHLGRLSERGLEQYWSASKCRILRWNRTLHQHAMVAEHTAPGGAQGHWQLLQPTVEEIYLSESLARVWAAICAVHDQEMGSSIAEPVARNILIGHIDSRNQAIKQILRQEDLPGELAAVEQTRRSIERWTDVLLGCFANRTDVSHLAFDMHRASSVPPALVNVGGGQQGTRSALVAAIQLSLQNLKLPDSPNSDLNQRIGASVMTCLQPEVFDSTGLLKSWWMERMLQMTGDTVGLIEDLLHLEAPETTLPSLSARRF